MARPSARWYENSWPEADSQAMDEAPTSTGPSTPADRLRAAWRAARLWLIFIAGIAGVVAALSVPITQRATSIGLEVGDVAPNDILAPYALSYTSEVLTQQARQAAADAVPAQYDPPDSAVARQQLERLHATLDFIEAVRDDSYASREQRLADLAALSDVRLDNQTAQALLDLPEPRWKAVRLEALSVLEQVMRSEIREDRLEEARRAVPALVSISLPEDQAQLVVTLVTAYVAPNARYNDQATEAAREQARQAVAPVVKSYSAGETIIGRGEVVSPLEVEALEAFGLLKPRQPWKDIALRVLLVTALACALALYGYRRHLEQVRNVRLVLTLAALFTMMALTLQVMIPGHTVLPYLYPAATLPILMTVLFGPGMGVLTSLIMGTLIGYLAPRGLEVAVYAALSGTMGALVIGDAERLTSFFWSGVAATLAAVAVIVVFRFTDPATDAVGKATLIAAALASGTLSAILALGLLLPLGNLLGITTTLQLVELSRPDHPLLQLILRNAPGTYQHSLQVANLAEQAARAIGANPLLTRVGALYHDAGKALRPQFFIENQVPGQNVHEQLDPATSADVILGHVKDGLDLARKYHLPPSIQAFITEHHGTLETRYQYHAALEAAGGDEDRIDRADFVYPGPRPRSRETALLMLADSVEAKARAEAPQDEEALDKIVRWVIQDRLQKGQLDHTDLTLKDLDTIRRSFVSTLKGMYHPRIRYPETPSCAGETPPAAPQETRRPPGERQPQPR